MTRQALNLRPFLHRLRWLAVLAAIAPVVSVHAEGPHPRLHDRYKHQVEKLEDAWRTAQLSGDSAAMDQLLSDDYVGITMSGQVVTKMQQLDRMKNRAMVLTKMEFSDVKIKLLNTTAIVTTLADVDGTTDGEPIHGTYRSTRVYSRSPAGVWKITNFEATRVNPPQEQGRGPFGDRSANHPHDHPHEDVPPPQ